jgi:hypothetical protein
MHQLSTRTIAAAMAPDQSSTTQRLLLLAGFFALCLAASPAVFAEDAADCSAPAVRIEADDFTPVTSKNYARAETQ